MRRTQPITITLVALAASLLGAGCGGSTCEDVCAEAQSCSGDVTFGGEECADECAEAQTLAEEAGCEDDFEDLLDCMDDVDDVCSEGALQDECTGPALSYGLCGLQYCSENPDGAGCGSSVSEPSCSTFSSGASPACTVGVICSDRDFELSCSDDECTCSEDGVTSASVANSQAFCDGDLDARVDAASTACGGWDF